MFNFTEEAIYSMKQIFINLPVNDLEKSMNFYLHLGFTMNPLFTDKDQKCMIWCDQIYVMLQSKDFFGDYIKKPIVDSKKFQSASFTLPVESPDKVNELIESGIKAGGIEPVPMLDEGFMLLRTIEDLDGYTWGIIHLDMDTFNEVKSTSEI